MSYAMRDRLSNWMAFILLLALLVVMVAPLLMVTINSFKTETEYTANGPLAMPESLSTESLSLAWNRIDYPTKLMNSVWISLASSVLAIVISLFNAFAMGIGRIRGATFFLIFFIIAITLPNESLIYPHYYMFKWAGLYDTRLSVILILAALNTAFGTYLLTSMSACLIGGSQPVFRRSAPQRAPQWSTG